MTNEVKPILAHGSAELNDLGHCVKRAMLLLGYPWFEEQNVISVEAMDPDGRMNSNRPNAFDDIKMIVNGAGKVIGGPWEATTQPGKFWTDNPMAPGGAFIIAKGPQAIWTPGDYHGRTVWRQAEDSTVMGFRDPNKTYKRIGLAIKHGNIGIHHHHGYNLPRGNISNAAAGCQVIRLTEGQQEFMDITLRNPEYLKNKKRFRMTATVLSAAEIGSVDLPPLVLDVVRDLQAHLNFVMKLDPPLVVDGDYGVRTKAAVKAFQRSVKLPVDGIAGPDTWQVLRATRMVLL